MTAPSDLTIDHDEDARRFHLLREGRSVGVLAYRPVGRPGTDLVDVYTTQISPSVRGQGLGEVLVRSALDDFRSRGTSVKASCWYVADFLDANADYQDLREGAGKPVASKIPGDRSSAGAARDAHEHGMADTAPGPDGGTPGRPVIEDR